MESGCVGKQERTKNNGGGPAGPHVKLMDRSSRHNTQTQGADIVHECLVMPKGM